MATRGDGTETVLPHRDAPLWVWHAWLCHGADPDGSQGNPCPDGCDVQPDRYRLKLMQGAEIEARRRVRE